MCGKDFFQNKNEKPLLSKGPPGSNPSPGSKPHG